MDRQLLARATEGTDAPTPGYIYVDLAKSATANPAAAQEMANYLIKRLSSKQNPNIKWKCCKVISKLCDQVPRNQFRRCLSNNPASTAAIKEAMAFRGAPDAVRGDAPNERVRVAAKEALDAVYSESSSSEMANHGGGGGGGMGISSSYAPSPYAQSGGGGGGGMGGGGGGGARRMEGIGGPQNSAYNPGGGGHQQQHGHHPNAHLKAVVQEAGSVLVSMIKDPLARNVTSQDTPRQGHSGNLPGYGGPTYGRPPPGASELMKQTNGQWSMASNRGPGAIQPNAFGPGSGGGGISHSNNMSGSAPQNQEYYKARDQQPGSSFNWASQQQGGQGGGGGGSAGGIGGSWATAGAQSVASRAREQSHGHSTPSVTINHDQQHQYGGGGGGGGGTAVSDGTYEKNLILELCPAGGLKAVPPEDKLANFKRMAASLNPDLICPVLLDCLEEGQPWIIRAKALCVMEACIQAGARSGHAENPYANFFHACAEEIAPMANHARAAIKEPAQRVLQLLGVADIAATAGTAQGRSAPVAAAPAPNLLDFDDAPAPGGQPPAPPPTQPPPPPPVETAPSSSGGGSMFGGMQVKSSSGPVVAAAPVVAPAPTSGNLLDFMGDDASATTAATAASAPAATNGTSNGAMFPDMNAATSSTTTTTSMFAQLNMGDKKMADSQDPGDLSTISNGSSAFGFMNQTPSQPTPASDNAEQPHQQPPPPAPGQQQQSFDPLMNVTPDTAQRKMMQVSPEQMQAMAYQQMRMQQQMQHMQMAYMQQGGRPGQGGPMPPMYPALGGAGGNVGGVPGGGHVGIMGSNLGGAASSGFSFMDARPVKKDDKKFDFVKDAMQSANKK